MSYRVIALDLDGTLLDDQKRILPGSLTALNLARKAGRETAIVITDSGTRGDAI